MIAVIEQSWYPETTNYTYHGKLLTHMTVDYTDFDEIAHTDHLHFFYPVCCQSYTTNEGDEHVELCGRHAGLAADTTLPAVEKWKGELNVLYGEWLAASREGDRAAIAFSQAFFTLWLEQQTHALQLQNAENVDGSIEAILRNQCVGLCRTVFELTIE